MSCAILGKRLLPWHPWFFLPCFHPMEDFLFLKMKNVVISSNKSWAKIGFRT
jgi:hypothetical protein